MGRLIPRKCIGCVHVIRCGPAVVAPTGAINVTWDPNSQVLKCRVVTCGGDPGPIVGDLLDYLLRHHARRIRSLTVIPRAGA